MIGFYSWRIEKRNKNTVHITEKYTKSRLTKDLWPQARLRLDLQKKESDTINGNNFYKVFNENLKKS